MRNHRHTPIAEPTRRRALQILGVGAASLAVPAVSAGCSKSDQATSRGAEFHGAYPYDAPPKGHFNILSGVTGGITMGFFKDLILIPGATYLWADKTWYYLLADESSNMTETGTTFTYKVRDGLKWSDNEPITAQDVYTTWLCRWAMNHEVFTYIDSFEKTDDMTVTFHIATPAPIVEYYLLREQPVSDKVYGQLAGRAEKLMKNGTKPTDDAATKLTQDIAKLRPQEATVSGPLNYDYDHIANSQLQLVKNDKGHKAEDVKFDKFVIYNGATAQSVAPIIASKKVDYATHGFTPPEVKQFTSNGLRILRTPNYFGIAIYFNTGKYKELADPRVRQAFAYAIDRDQNGRVTYGKSGKGVKHMAGFSDVEVPTWVTDEGIDDLNRYEHDPDRAMALLKEAGWTTRGKHWITSQGRQAHFDLLTVNTADYSAAIGNAADQLRSLGIKITVNVEEGTQRTVDIDAGKFQLGAATWGSSTNPYPYEAFRTAFLSHNSQTDPTNPGMGFDLKQSTESVGEIDLLQAITEAGQGVDLAAQKAAVTKVALAFNELLPCLPLNERYGNNPVLEGERVTGWPDDGDPVYQNSPYADCFTTILLYKSALHPPKQS